MHVSLVAGLFLSCTIIQRGLKTMSSESALVGLRSFLFIAQIVSKVVDRVRVTLDCSLGQTIQVMELVSSSRALSSDPYEIATLTPHFLAQLT